MNSCNKALTKAVLSKKTQADKLLNTISCAFNNDPLWTWAFPDPISRKRFLAQFIEGALRYSWVYNTRKF